MDLIDFTVLALTSLFTMVNPLSLMTVYNSMTATLNSTEARNVAIKASVTAIVTLIIFALLGKFIFELFGISVNALRIVGGIIFLFVGYDMLQARMVRTKTSDETITEFANDIAITPLGIPMICGPGAITVVMILMNDSKTIEHKLILLAAIIVVMSINLVFMLGSRKILAFIGTNGNKVMMRVMGLIVMVIAIEFFLSGIKTFIGDILKEIK